MSQPSTVHGLLLSRWDQLCTVLDTHPVVQMRNPFGKLWLLTNAACLIREEGPFPYLLRLWHLGKWWQGRRGVPCLPLLSV